MHHFRFVLLSLVTLAIPILVACGASSETQAPVQSAASTESPRSVEYAPELASIDDWLNSEPLTLEELRGQAVLLVFWSDT
jgi:hypothetical protein